MCINALALSFFLITYLRWSLLMKKSVNSGGYSISKRSPIICTSFLYVTAKEKFSNLEKIALFDVWSKLTTEHGRSAAWKKFAAPLQTNFLSRKRGNFLFRYFPRSIRKRKHVKFSKNPDQLADLRFLRRERQSLVWKGCYQTIIWPIFNDNFMKIK